MKKIGFLFAAALALGSFSGCKKKGGDMMGKMTEFKDHMCACKDGDKDCAMKVQKEMADYAEAHKDEIDFQIFLQWITARSGETRPAPAVLGSADLSVLDAAPGCYVMEN